MEELSKEKLHKESVELFTKLEGRAPDLSTMDNNTVGLIEHAIKRGYRLGFDEFYVPMCEKCEYRNATCFGPGQFCDECSMEEDEEE